MDKVDKHIEATFGRKAPFKVPEGYFDDFTVRMMDQLPGQAVVRQAVVCDLKPSLWKRYRKAIAVAAASVVVGMMGLGTYLHNGKTATDKEQLAGTASSATATSSYSSADAFADYAMLDTDDMYAYMADIK